MTHISAGDILFLVQIYKNEHWLKTAETSESEKPHSCVY